MKNGIAVLAFCLALCASERTSLGHVRSNGAMSLPVNMLPGEYIPQVIVSDGAGKGRQAAQYIQFELM